MRMPALTAVTILAFAAAACTPAEKAETKAEAADAGSAIKEEAQQVGSAVAAGASEVAQEVDEATDKLAEKADEQRAETATDEKGN